MFGLPEREATLARGDQEWGRNGGHREIVAGSPRPAPFHVHARAADVDLLLISAREPAADGDFGLFAGADGVRPSRYVDDEKLRVNTKWRLILSLTPSNS